MLAGASRGLGSADAARKQHKSSRGCPSCAYTHRISDDLPLTPSLQTSIRAEGFRSLREGEEVEFDVEPGEDGRNKAINVSGPGGAPPLVSATCPLSPLLTDQCAGATWSPNFAK